MGKSKEIPDHVACVCTGSKCKRYNKHLLSYLKDIAKNKNSKYKLEVIKTHCLGRCKEAPVICLQPENKWLLETTEKMLEHQVKKLIL